MRVARRSDDGFTIVGVVVASVMLLLALIPAAALLEATVRVSGDNRNRVVAANLATAQLENLRSLSNSTTNFNAMAQQYVGNTVTSTQKVGGVTYTVATNMRWSAGTFSSGSCAASAAENAPNLNPVIQTTVTVTWTNQRLATPVTESGVINPPYGAYNTQTGNLSVLVQNAAGNGDPNVQVSISGYSSLGAMVQGVEAASTDVNGCAFFANLPVGNYNIDLSYGGYVLAQSTPQTSALTPYAPTWQVTAGTTTPAQFQYDQGFSVQLPTSDNNSMQVAQEFGLTLSNPNLTKTSGVLTYPASTFSATSSVGSLYPYTGGYTYWYGTCFINTSTSQYPFTTPSPAYAPTAPQTTTPITPYYGQISVTVVDTTSPSTTSPSLSGDALLLQPVDNGSGAACPNPQSAVTAVSNLGDASVAAATPYAPYGYFNVEVVNSSGTLLGSALTFLSASQPLATVTISF